MRLRKMIGMLTCAAVITCGTCGTAFAASTAEDPVAVAAVTAVGLQNVGEEPNITQSGPLTIEAHLLARMAYPEAYYRVLIYAPSDVVGIRINNNDIVTGNGVQLSGTAYEVTPHTGNFGSITVKVTLFYEDKNPYVSYETINVSQWCGSHTRGPNCF